MPLSGRITTAGEQSRTLSLSAVFWTRKKKTQTHMPCRIAFLEFNKTMPVSANIQNFFEFLQSTHRPSRLAFLFASIVPEARIFGIVYFQSRGSPEKVHRQVLRLFGFRTEVLSRLSWFLERENCSTHASFTLLFSAHLT